MLRKALFALPLAVGLALLAPPPSLAAQDVDVTGTYTCQGKNPNGRTYTGRVEIVQKGDVYQVEWTIGRETHVGVGILEGRTLSVCWAVAEGSPGGGIVVYRVERDGRLVGKWTSLGGRGEVYRETLTPD
jgi:hypothetical protein